MSDGNGRNSGSVTAHPVKPKPGCSLEERHPEIAAEWHTTLNGDLTPSDVSSGSHVMVWWVCPDCGHVWKANVLNRTNGHGCPECAKRVRGEKKAIPRKGNSLAERCPEIAAQWHPTLNGDLTPSDVSRASDRLVWWRCPVDGYVWQSSICSRTLRSNDAGCPVCHGRAIMRGVNDLATVRPDIAAEWSDRNDIKPTEVTVSSSRLIWWVCPTCGNEYSTTVYNRTNGGCGCPRCASSHGERLVSSILTANEVRFTEQRWFDSCRDIKPLPFDFSVDDEDGNAIMLIEWDGRQHREPVDFSGHLDDADKLAKFKTTKRHDRKKTRWAKQHGIKLVRINDSKYDIRHKDGIEAVRKLILGAVASVGKEANRQAA